MDNHYFLYIPGRIRVSPLAVPNMSIYNNHTASQLIKKNHTNNYISSEIMPGYNTTSQATIINLKGM